MVNKAVDIPVVVEKDADGYYAFCPTLQGCYTQGDTYDEVMKNLADVIKLHNHIGLNASEWVSMSFY